MFHVSPHLGLKTLKPHVPWVDDEPPVPRVCAAPSLNGCVDALGDLEYGVTYYAYKILAAPDVSNGEVTQFVPDAADSGEVWYLREVECIFLGVVFSIL